MADTTLSSLVGAGGIKSVQAGTIDITGAGLQSNTATITAVNTSKAFVINLGMAAVSGGNTDGICRVALTNSTTVTAFKGVGSSATDTVGYVVVEFN